MNQRGMAMVAGLVLLTAVSLLAVTAANSMNLQRHQIANLEDALLAQNNARLAESWARAWLFSRKDVERQSGCLTGCLLPVAVHSAGELPGQPQLLGPGWWRSAGVAPATEPESGTAVAGAGVTRGSGFWLMEELHYEQIPPPESGPDVLGIGYYRIYSRGAGVNSRSHIVTESILARPWEGDYEEASFPPSGQPGAFCRQFSPETPCGTLAWRILK